MIAYFSGTGNTEWVAQQLSTFVCDDHLIPLPHNCVGIDFKGIDALGICFPVHSWGIPSIVRDFIQSLPKDHKIPYIYMVCTCGDDIGLTMQEFESLLEKQNQKASLYYSVQMPNSYVNLPGFDVDPVELQRKKVNTTEKHLKALSKIILERGTAVNVVKGSMPWLKSKVIRPFFYSYLVKDSFFHVENSCVCCGACAQACPVGNIQMNGGPVWLGNSTCLTCMACYHSCPQHAIRFGKYTDNKGQYLFKKLKR